MVVNCLQDKEIGHHSWLQGLSHLIAAKSLAFGSLTATRGSQPLFGNINSCVQQLLFVPIPLLWRSWTAGDWCVCTSVMPNMSLTFRDTLRDAVMGQLREVPFPILVSQFTLRLEIPRGYGTWLKKILKKPVQQVCVSTSKHAFLNQYGWRSSLSVRNFDHPCVIISCVSVNIYKAYGFSFKVTVKNLPLFVLHHLERVEWLPRRLSALINQPLGIIR